MGDRVFDDPWIFWLPVLYLYFVLFIGFQIKYDDDDGFDSRRRHFILGHM